MPKQLTRAAANSNASGMPSTFRANIGNDRGVGVAEHIIPKGCGSALDEQLKAGKRSASSALMPVATGGLSAEEAGKPTRPLREKDSRLVAKTCTPGAS